MSGTVKGGLKAAITNRERHGETFYQRIGAMGGAKGTTGGFAAFKACHCDVIEVPHHLAMCRGKLGGRTSRRGKAQQ